MTSLLRRFCERFVNSAVPAPFRILKHRSVQHVRQRLQREFPNAHVRVYDRDYSAPPKPEFERWLQEYNKQLTKYQRECYCSDDFARDICCKIFQVGQSYHTNLMIAYCVGWVPEYRAFNILIDNKDQIYLIDPCEDHCTPINEIQYRIDFIQL